MQFIDLQRQQQRISALLHERMDAVLASGRYILGPEVEELERELERFVGVGHCITVGNGTDAIQIALMALGIRPGDEVITTAFSFIATAEVIVLLGAVPVFVDVDPVSYNIDPVAVRAAITDRTRAIIPVSLYGQCADMDEINRIGEEFNLSVIEDGAQSFGATYRGKRSCGLSTIGCTSFFPSKPLGCYGDGGACFTDNDDLAAAMREIRAHGQSRRYFHSRVGVNSRLDTLQAAVLLAKLTVFEDEIGARQECAREYARLLADVDCVIPAIMPGNTSVYAQYTIQARDRATVLARFKMAGVPSAVHYPTPLHRQPAFATAQSPSLPVAEHLSEHVLSLPMHPYLTIDEQREVAEALR